VKGKRSGRKSQSLRARAVGGKSKVSQNKTRRPCAQGSGKVLGGEVGKIEARLMKGRVSLEGGEGIAVVPIK